MKYEKSLLEEALYHWNSTENEEKKLRKWIQSMEEEAEKAEAFVKICSVMEYNYPNSIDRVHLNGYQNPKVPLREIDNIIKKYEEVINSNPDIKE